MLIDHLHINQVGIPKLTNIHIETLKQSVTIAVKYSFQLRPAKFTCSFASVFLHKLLATDRHKAFWYINHFYLFTSADFTFSKNYILLFVFVQLGSSKS